MNLLDNPELVEKLTAEYVLGTLKGGARRRFETLLAGSPVLRRSVAEWQDRLHPMAQFAPVAQPSPQVWRGLVKRLNLNTAIARADKLSFWRGLRDDLAFWRGLGMVSTTLATILVGVLLTRQFGPATPTTAYVAMLADAQSMPVAMVSGDPAKHQLTIRLVNRQNIAADRSLELWALPKDGAPRSLGLLASDGSVTLSLPATMTPESVPLLAVSLEPKGGSPSPNAPTGPVIFKGAWVKV